MVCASFSQVTLLFLSISVRIQEKECKLLYCVVVLGVTCYSQAHVFEHLSPSCKISQLQEKMKNVCQAPVTQAADSTLLSQWQRQQVLSPWLTFCHCVIEHSSRAEERRNNKRSTEHKLCFSVAVKCSRRLMCFNIWTLAVGGGCNLGRLALPTSIGLGEELKVYCCVLLPVQPLLLGLLRYGKQLLHAPTATGPFLPWEG